MDGKDQHLSKELEGALASYCQVCFVPFSKITPKKIDEGSELLFCVKCKCRTHKSCYDVEVNSTYITSKVREFLCERCSHK